ncbi:MAG: hypothetical protein Q8N79_07000, partial [Candidatus Methanoperedens sp.]|nr:hypothetical protein [Candidatus Methanoperedens sp.]
MYQSEINKFCKKINGESISLSAKRALCDVVDEFFSEDYQNISEKRKGEIELNFKLRRIESTARYYRSDRLRVEEIFNQIENNLYTILDQSVDKSNPEKVETETELEVSSD